jgi:hypothetical protein
MKRTLTLLIIALVAIPFAGQAQKIDVDLGLKVGANFSNINGTHWESGYKANFLGGVFLGVNGPKLGVTVEGLFTQSTFVTGKGFYGLYKDAYRTAADSAKSGSFKVNYISIPVLLNIKLFSRATIQLGPQFSGVASVKDRDELLNDAQELFKGGFDGVIGVQLSLPAHLNVGARYIIGLSNINKGDGTTNNAGIQIDDAWKQRSLQLHIGYSIL